MMKSKYAIFVFEYQSNESREFGFFGTPGINNPQSSCIEYTTNIPGLEQGPVYLNINIFNRIRNRPQTYENDKQGYIRRLQAFIYCICHVIYMHTYQCSCVASFGMGGGGGGGGEATNFTDKIMLNYQVTENPEHRK